MRMGRACLADRAAGAGFRFRSAEHGFGATESSEPELAGEFSESSPAEDESFFAGTEP